jgi:hypothetical protein
LFDCSLSQISLIILFIFEFYFLFFSFFSSIFSGHQFPFSKRKVLAQSFKTRPFLQQSMQGASKIQKVRARN